MFSTNQVQIAHGARDDWEHRAILAIQDKPALNPEEEAAIELKREFVAGQERTLWNPTLSFPPRDFGFTEAEIARIRMVLETWASFGADAERRRLEPLLRDLVSGNSE